jgi:hypothetical protein
MTIKIRPSRRGNFDVTGTRLTELGVAYTGYDHHQNCYVGVVIPPGLEATVASDPLIEVEADMPATPRKAGPVWSTARPGDDPTEIGRRLRRFRTDAGLDLAGAAALSGGQLSADAIDRIERTGACAVRDLIVLADVYAASLDHITGRSVIGGNRRR